MEARLKHVEGAHLFLGFHTVIFSSWLILIMAMLTKGKRDNSWLNKDLRLEALFSLL